MDTLLEPGRARRRATCSPFCDGGYTTNLPIADVTGGQAWVAFGYDGEPLDPEHGGPGAAARPAPVLLEEREVGARAASCAITTSRASGRPTAITCTETHGGNSGTRATDLAGSPRSARSPTRRPRCAPSQLDVPDWPGHRAGQHLDVRLTAEDGYRAERSYSIASAPGRAGGDHGRAAGRRRGLAVPHRGAAGRATSSSCAARSAATSSGTRRTAARCCCWPAARGSSRCGPSCGTGQRTGSDVPVRLLYSVPHAGRT